MVRQTEKLSPTRLSPAKSDREVGGVPGEAGGGGPLTLPREVGGVPGEAGGGGRATAPQGRGLVVIRPEA